MMAAMVAGKLEVDLKKDGFSSEASAMYRLRKALESMMMMMMM